MSTFKEEYSKFKTPKEIIREALEGELNFCLIEVTEKQKDFFFRIWPKGVESIPYEDLSGAIDLCHRTMAKNNLGER